MDYSLPAQFDVMYQASRSDLLVPLKTRLHRLNQLQSMLKMHQAAICEAINQDFGHRSTDETLLLEFFSTLSGIQDAQKHTRHWMKTKKAKTHWRFLPAGNEIRPQALGVVGIVAPWNYPLFSTIGPMVGAFAAGNRVMVKTSEYAPHFSHWLSKTVADYFAADELVVVEGGIEVATEFIELPFDHLLFTGSSAVGKIVMQAASQNLTPVTLELGGKSPAIILADANFEHAVSRIMSGKLLNAGQTCIAPDYVYLPEEKIADFIRLAKVWVAKHYPDMANNPDYTSIINQRQYARLQTWLSEAQEQGADLMALNQGDAKKDSHQLLPMLALNVPNDCALMQEEIFGPILPLLPYQNIEIALKQINQRARPLALYVFGQDKAKIDFVLNQTVSGGVCVNDTLFHAVQESLPFGGVGASGMGAYHGKTGFDTFSHLKPVFKQAKINSMSLLLPPYGTRFRALLKFLIG